MENGNYQAQPQHNFNFRQQTTIHNNAQEYTRIHNNTQEYTKIHNNIQKTLNPAETDKVNSYQHFVSHPHSYLYKSKVLM